MRTLSPSARWYAVPGNADRRKHRMRCYSRALSALSRAHKGEYHLACQQALDAGCSQQRASQAAYAAVRERHPEEFRLLFEAEIAGHPALQQAKRAMAGD